MGTRIFQSNHEMCEIVLLKSNAKRKDARIAELEKYLNRAIREIETLQAMAGDNQSDLLLERIKEVLSDKVKIIY